MDTPLKIGILSLTSIRERPDVDDLMIRRAAIALGHKVQIYIAHHFQFTFDANEGPSLLYKNRKFNPPDIMIIRAYVLTDIDLKLSIVKQLQLMGVPTVNHYLPIVRAKNKVRTLQILNHAGIPIPKTFVLNNAEYMDAAVEQIGSFPVIVKTTQGSMGNGVTILESRRSLRSVLDTIPKTFYLIQEYVKEAKGKDLRVFVVGGKIVAAMERKAKKGEFRANFQQGGSVSNIDLTEEEKKISLEATRLIGLDVSGVDIIRTSEGPKILEINSNPGLEGITMATGVNVAETIVKFAENVARRKRGVQNKARDLVIAA